MLSRNESLSKTENEQRVQRALLAVIKFRATVHVYRLSRIILVLYSPRTTAPRIIITVAASLSLVFGMYWPSCDCFLCEKPKFYIQKVKYETEALFGFHSRGGAGMEIRLQPLPARPIKPPSLMKSPLFSIK